MDNRRQSNRAHHSRAEQRSYDLAVEREQQGREWRRQIEAELQDDLCDLDEEAQYRNVRFRTRRQLLLEGGTIRDVKRVMNSADVAAIPYEMLWNFLNESEHQDHWLPKEEIAKFLQVSPLPRAPEGDTGSQSASENSGIKGSSGLTSSSGLPDASMPVDSITETGPNPRKRRVTKRGEPRLSKREINAAVDAYVQNPANADFRDEDILRDLPAAYPDFFIPRDPILKRVREIMPGRKRGPRPIREENSAE